MLRWLLVLALFVVAPATAAPPKCWPDPAMPISLEIAIKPTRVELGTVVYAASPVGLVFGWACKAADGTHNKVIAGGPWEAFAREWLYLADKALRGTVADREALWSQYSTVTEWDARLQPDLDAVWALLPNAPAPIVWKVMPDPFRADKKRLVYVVANGKRGASTGRYVEAGTPCDPATTIVEYGPVYFLSVEGNPNTVARCAQ